MVIRPFKAQKTINNLDYFAETVVVVEVCLGNKIVLSKIGQGNELRTFAKNVVAKDIGQGNEIHLS